MYDVDNLLQVLHVIIENGNTVIMVEHNMDLIKASDYIIDMGPGAGKLGGKVVAVGSPTEVANCPSSITGKYMKA
jgi:excinuclease ABC subunit A